MYDKRRIKKILFIVPPTTLPKDSVKRIAEPLGILYMGAVLKNKGYEVEVFDASCEGYDKHVEKDYYITYGVSDDEIKEQIKKIKPDIVAVSCLLTARENDSLMVCRCAKEVDKNMPVVVGGIHANLFPKKLLNTNLIDFVILGEGEFRLPHLLDDLNEGKDKFDFDGVAYTKDNAQIVNPVQKKIDDINDLPYPDRDLVNMEKYFEIGVPYAPFSAERRVAQVLATRGCPNNCNFCATINLWGRKVRARSVDNIINELKMLKEKYGVKEVQFIDDNLTVNKQMAKELFRKMKSLGLKWCTPNGLMFNTLDKEMIKLMAECGAYQLTFAIESASERVLKNIIHKNVRLDLVKEMVDEAHKYDISVHGMFLMGFPGETREEIFTTLDFPFKIGFDSVSFFVVNPMPGSQLYQECIDKGYIDETYSAMDFKTAHIKIPKDSPEYNFDVKELEELIDKKTREYNEFAKKLFPERWNRKFKRFLSERKECKSKIMGRVT